MWFPKKYHYNHSNSNDYEEGIENQRGFKCCDNGRLSQMLGT